MNRRHRRASTKCEGLLRLPAVSLDLLGIKDLSSSLTLLPSRPLRGQGTSPSLRRFPPLPRRLGGACRGTDEQVTRGKGCSGIKCQVFRIWGLGRPVEGRLISGQMDGKIMIRAWNLNMTIGECAPLRLRADTA